MLDDEGNLIGGTLTKLRQQVAIKVLKKGYEVESLRTSQGYIWLRKGKTSKQVNPNKVDLLLLEGWRKTKIADD